MTTGLSQRLDRVARDHFPIAITVFFAILSATPFYIPGYGMVAASLTLMAVFFWSVHRADLLSPAAVFVIGLLHDILSGTPPGMNALIFVLLRVGTATIADSLAGKPFLVLWLGFSAAGLAAGFLHWLINVIWYFELLDPTPVIFQTLLTITLFPFVGWLLVWLQHKLLPVN